MSDTEKAETGAAPDAAEAAAATEEIPVPSTSSLPSEDELKLAVTEFLSSTEDDMATMTIRKVLTALEEKFKTSLAEVKGVIKDAVTAFIRADQESESSSSGSGSDSESSISDSNLSAAFKPDPVPAKKTKKKPAAKKRAAPAKKRAPRKTAADKAREATLRDAFGSASSSDDSESSEIVRKPKRKKAAAPAKKAATTRKRKAAPAPDAGERRSAKRVERFKAGGADDAMSDSGGPTDSSGGKDDVATKDDLAFIERGDSSSDDDDVIRTEKRPDYSDDEGAGQEDANKKEANEFDLILERIKPKRKTNKYTPAQMAEVCKAFRQKMSRAAKADADSNRKKEPGVKKLQMLPEVMEKLGNINWANEFAQNGVFAELRQWIFPLPDRSLPSTKVRTEVLKILLRLPFDLQQLRSSGVGKVVNFLSRNDKESESNKLLCRKILAKWSRPIYNLSTDMRDASGDVVAAEVLTDDREQQQRRAVTATNVSDDALNAQQGVNPGMPGYTPHARIPIPMTMDFKHRPEISSKLAKGERKGSSMSQRAGMNFKQKKIQGKVAGLKPPPDKIGRLSKVSISRN